MKNFNHIVLNEIYTIADNLIEISFQNSDNATWLNMLSTTNAEKSYNFMEESNFSLLNGVLGDALFFFTLAKKQNKEKYEQFAKKVYKSFLTYLTEINLQTLDTGLLTGLGGVIYCLTKLYEITKNDVFLKDLEGFLKTINIEELLREDTFCSIVSGKSGLLISLCKYYEYCSNKSALLSIINDCCERLIKESKSTSEYVFWLPQHHKKPLAGVAHGASGYALAFHEAYRITKNIKYQEIVQKIILFENTLFDKNSNNWVDNRDFVMDEMKGATVAWSHGAPGIGLIRDKLLKSQLYDPEFDKIVSNDLNLAIKKTVAFDLSNNKDIVIFGNLGSIDLLINTGHQEELENQLKIIVEKSAEKGWNYGYRLKDFHVPGFFYGASGIAYQLLRSLDNKTPSILSFD
jgi:lantibiotic modifying enzyme